MTWRSSSSKGTSRSSYGSRPTGVSSASMPRMARRTTPCRRENSYRGRTLSGTIRSGSQG
eukprot:10074417-Alexandrium_andersonii.AAC.1